MALRRLLGCLVVAALATACKDKGADKGPDTAVPASQASAADLDKRCVQLGKVCGDKDKHVEKIVEECKLTAKKQVEKGCAAQAIAVYDCYEKELCAGHDKVWAIEDLRVLADRGGKCLAERTASRGCTDK